MYRIMHTITLDVRSTCRIIQGLSREQLDLCYKANDVTIAALDGLDLAMRECQLQVNQAYTHFSILFKFECTAQNVCHTHWKRLKVNPESWEYIKIVHFCFWFNSFLCSFSGIVGIVHHSIQKSVIHTYRIYWKKVSLTCSGLLLIVFIVTGFR